MNDGKSLKEHYKRQVIYAKDISKAEVDIKNLFFAE